MKLQIDNTLVDLDKVVAITEVEENSSSISFTILLDGQHSVVIGRHILTINPAYMNEEQIDKANKESEQNRHIVRKLYNNLKGFWCSTVLVCNDVIVTPVKND